MITKTDIQKLIDECRYTGSNGLGNGSRATIQELTVDFLAPPTDFLGIGSNPAIFVNHDTYSLLGKHHAEWEVNKTIAVKERFLEKKPIMVIGIIIHETGHAFNVAANITNSEGNAYIFEIEVISIWFKTNNPWLFNCSRADLQAFFESRLPYYNMETKHNPYLAELVSAIEQNKMLAPLDSTTHPHEPEKMRASPRFVIPTPKLVVSNPMLFFKNDSAYIPTTKSQVRLPEKSLADW